MIPQIKRDERLNPSQLKDIYVTGPDKQADPAQHLATIRAEDRAALAQSFPAVQCRHDQRRVRPAARSGFKLLEDEAAKILPKGYTIDYTGESRQLRSRATNFCPPSALAVILIFLVLAAQFNSFRDPLIILLGSVPLAMFGALIFTFLKMPNPDVPFFTNGWTTTIKFTRRSAWSRSSA